VYFFDTYAIIESFEGNPRYSRFEPYPFVISVLNVGEFYQYLIRTLGRGKAEEVIESNSFNVVEISKETIMEAVLFRNHYKKIKFSWADAIGYVFAKRNQLKFLTGDAEFKGLQNVEFAK